MRSLHLFAGAGGGLLADLILGHTPIGAVENNPYCCDVLRARRDDGWFPGLAVHEIDIRDFDASEYAGRVDIVAGGFPCQDISAAGKGAGITGERSGLWSEFVRVIRLVRPRFVFVENSPMLTLRGLDVVLADLAALGMDAVWTVVSAADAGAPHRRERIWILAHANGLRLEEHVLLQSNLSARSGEMANASCPGCPAGGPAIGHGPHGQICDVQSADGGCLVAHANSVRKLQPQGRECDERGWAGDGGCQIRDSASQGLSHRPNQSLERPGQNAKPERSGWWTTEPDVGVLADGLSPDVVPGWWEQEPDIARVATGVKNRVGKLKALGNGQVPLQAAIAWRILSDAILGGPGQRGRHRGRVHRPGCRG